MKRVEGWTVWTAALTLMGGAGIAVFFLGYAFPVYTDHRRASALKRAACDAEYQVIPGWHDKLDALETLRHPLMQGGLSLALAAITALMLGQIFRNEDALGVRTPARIATYFMLGIGVLGLSCAAQIFSLELDYDRGELPWCADSSGIAVFGLIAGYMILGVICLVVGGALSRCFGDLPQPLGVWCAERPVASSLISMPFVLLAAAIAALAVLEATGSAFIATPASVATLYLVEATRSALVARLEAETQPA